jgi:hypothetical protein
MMTIAAFVYLIFKNTLCLPNFSYGMLCCVTFSTSSWYVSKIGFTEKNKDDGDNDVDDDS